MALNFLPKEGKFFELFDEQAATISKAVQLVKQAVRGDEEAIKKIRDIEHEGDTITHEITDTLNRCFITPFDREDILSLANKLDNVIDKINALATRIRIYRVKLPDNDLIAFADIFELSAAEIVKVVSGLRNTKHANRILQYCIELNRLENMGDNLREQVLIRIFEETKDPIELLKWKEIYEIAETCTDDFEHAAKIVESIIVKQG